jgi:hypothetical protein
MASFSYDSNMKTVGKSSSAAEKNIGKTTIKNGRKTYLQPNLDSTSDISADSSKSSDSSSTSSMDTRPDVPKTITIR